MSQAELKQLFDMRMVLGLPADTVRSLREQGTEPQGFADLRAYFDVDWVFHLTFFHASGNYKALTSDEPAPVQRDR